MKNFILSAGLACLAPFFLAGCATPVQQTTPGGPRSLETTGITVGDCQAVAEKMVGSLLASGVLDRVPKPPAIIAVSWVANNTGLQNLNTHMITTKITTALSQSGKAQTRLNIGVGADGQQLVQDPITAGSAQEKEFTSGKDAGGLPDYSLSGEIIQTYARAGNMRENTYTFHLRLAKDNLTVWEEEKEIGKLSKRPGVGF
jgi:PBP1b-binding outer membrane lipoprotein LpoB